MNKLKIISWNANGIRTRMKNKDTDPIFEAEPDIILFQETKAEYEQIDKKFLEECGYNYYFLKGESARTGGLATFIKESPKIVKNFFNESNDSLRRASVLEFNNFILIHIYAPVGTGNKAKLVEKLEFFEELLKLAKKFADKKVIIGGDFNIAHTENDIFDINTKVTFKEEERNVLDDLESLGYVDTLRLFNKDKIYSSWKNQEAKENNEGSRLDYFFVSKELVDNVKSSEILVDIDSSKHAPIELNLE